MDYAELVPPERLEHALVEATGTRAWSDFSVELVSGGKSNLTFLLTNVEGEHLILRRPPTGELLPSAHDMAREARVQRALASTAIPVPGILLYDDGTMIGVPCYVMERVPGHIIRAELPVGYAESPEDRATMAHVLVDTLADLHAVDPVSIGLGDYGRPSGFMERQLRRWGAQWEATRTCSVPEIERLARLLAQRLPPQGGMAIVHGDFRTDNVVYDCSRPGRIEGVLDWELSTLGDPLSDVGQLMLYWRASGEPQFSLIPGVSQLPGMPHRDVLAERYALRSGADLSQMHYYRAFAYYKFAIIAQGVSVRSRAGAMGGQDFGNLDEEIRYLGQCGLEILKEQ